MNSQSPSSDSQLIRSSRENIGPDDSRYADLNRKGFNKRFEGKPDYFRLVSSTADVVNAVQHAVDNNLRLAVRSGGHCLENFVSNADVRVVIDTSQMTSVTWDFNMKAFAIEAGTTLGEMHRKLFIGWNVVLPVGQSPDIGIGGHALGSAFGFLHREHGLAVDFLYAIELVHVDRDGTARSVIATREANDPNRDLWWAHTGCGGGNFGIVTRYWFRANDAEGSDATRALPRAPESVVTREAEWNWDDVNESAFTTLIRNYGTWCEQNADANSSYATMFSVISAPCQGQGQGQGQGKGKVELRAMSIAGASAEQQIDAHFAAIGAGVGKAHIGDAQRMSWLTFAVNPFPDLYAINPGGTAASPAKVKIKDALLKQRHTDTQIAIMYEYLTRDAKVGGSVGFATYGGRMNEIASDATAAAQRASVMDTSYSAGWMNNDDEARSLQWVRELYRDLFAETGGVPVPNSQTEGAIINHPDSDIASADWNTSGVSFGTIYYGDNYARLRQVKATWDARNVFHHALSIELP
ncbi:MAG: FAD-binding oxidoreductase [Gemmatimonadaceae bacterium]